MSIISAIYADMANEKVEKWVRRLTHAYDMRDWNLVRELIADMKSDKFEE